MKWSDVIPGHRRDKSVSKFQDRRYKIEWNINRS